ncbi:probable galacturonosyltransferase 3 isoform X1 [Phalaenopsis equestris]|uniref:probable galacturonosyltransferase 3 isoform X1 n=1 Tax=Phalaenopsis equestris TaxID=78828 RepID=UPI0009E5A544|nr:probable galacturonosyltransferase 3 isoform X1 [Phalaenopsis equestris]
MATSKRLALLGFLVLLLVGGLMWLGCQKYDGVSKKADNVHGLKDCQDCDKKKENDVSMENFAEDVQYVNSDEGIDITVAYTDVSGDVRTHRINSRDLSSSWVWENPGTTEKTKVRDWSPQQIMSKSKNDIRPFVDQIQQTNSITPLKLKRQQLKQRRREKRAAELINMSEETELEIQATAIKHSKEFNSPTRRKYTIWRIEYQNPNSDSILKLMKDQIIMAKVYASIAHSMKKLDLYDSLVKHIRESQHSIEDASTDTDLQQGALEYAKTMGRALSIAKDVLYECDLVDQKLRVMIQSTEKSINTIKKQSTFLIQHAAKTFPRPLHCFPLHLTTDYYLHGHHSKQLSSDNSKLSDASLFHYAIFSDNVLATSVVVNSTVVHAKEPQKHVFHIVTDRLNFAAMRMWFIKHPHLPATLEVQNIDEFKWLNSSYCAVLRQLESARIKEYYFKANHPSSLSTENENLKYRNPKYLSMLNHLRFYMPEVYPKLDKILFLDDDIVVQKDLTPIWSIDMKGMVNGAVETCKESFHRFDTYLNFSNPKISNNFDPQACGWAFGMNLFDLKEWKRRNITGIYHYWQNLNEDRKLWKLGSLPPGLITFYNLTYPLDRRWHVLGLGYDPAVNSIEIENAAVIHYNGNYKPWLDLAVVKYKPYWSKFVNFDDPYVQFCSIPH